MSQAVHVLDRLHIMQLFGKALEEIRAGEARRMTADGYQPVLKRSRWRLLKRKEHLTERQTARLQELLQYDLPSVRACLLRADFQRFWECVGPTWAGKFWEEGSRRTMRPRLEPLQNVARTLRNHRALIRNWFVARGEISAGAVEGRNNQGKLAARESYGCRTARAAKLASFHHLARLSEPNHTHRFC